ncbi:hypothetical protein H2248_011506 [Termitomyces sp. 'cryptogamus']|nr:hypothetical protein H2248_011506 [Termitomyces sp. 'cryptogamus']
MQLTQTSHSLNRNKLLAFIFALSLSSLDAVGLINQPYQRPTIAQSAAARIPEVDREQGLSQEAPPGPTDLDNSVRPPPHTAASSRGAGDLPACEADAPEPVVGRDAHFVGNEGMLVERQSSPHDKKSSTDEYCDTYSHLTVDTNSPVFGSNNIFSGESTPVQISKKLRY